MDSRKYQYEGMKWLHELELLNSPLAVSNVKLNILMVSKRIKEVELLIYRENKSMLVLLDLTWFGRKFFKKRIFIEVQEVLTQLLPSFRFRVTDDPKIMEMAVERVKQAITGGQNEKPTNPSVVPSKPADTTVDNPDVIAAAAFAAVNASIENSKANSQEQPQATEAVQSETGSTGSRKE